MRCFTASKRHWYSNCILWFTKMKQIWRSLESKQGSLNGSKPYKLPSMCCGHIYELFGQLYDGYKTNSCGTSILLAPATILDLAHRSWNLKRWNYDHEIILGYCTQLKYWCYWWISFRIEMDGSRMDHIFIVVICKSYYLNLPILRRCENISPPITNSSTMYKLLLSCKQQINNYWLDWVVNEAIFPLSSSIQEHFKIKYAI